MAKILKGADVVRALGEKMSLEIENLKKNGITPTLATLRVGERADDISYEKSIKKRCESVGVAVKSIVFPSDVTQDELLICIDGFNNDKKVHGVLMFRPLPDNICEDTIRNALRPEKDIDGITDASLASVFAGSDKGFAPCTARACIEILDFYGIDCTGKKAVVIGRSLVVGKPVAIMLMGKNATVTVCHTRTVDIPAIARKADILIVAAGRAESITEEFLSSAQVVIDVGINWNEEKQKLVGDVRFEDAELMVKAVTPVPGGVGTVTTSVLVSNVVKAAGMEKTK